MNNPFWDYSLATYHRKEVAPTCLALQDAYGLDVNLLLYAAWLAHMDRRLSEAHLEELEAVIAGWRGEVVKPLRALRRQLADYPAPDLRDGIKALELRAEQEQQAIMYTCYRQSSGLPAAAGTLRDNLALVGRFASPFDTGWTAGIGRLASLIAP